MSFSPLLEELIESLRCLPGVGPRSAQRMAFHLLHADRTVGQHLAQTIQKALTHIGHCQLCRTFSENQLCQICTHSKREQHLLCIVETPADIKAIEQTRVYRGLYFVLHGHLSPLDGIGPKQLGIPELTQRLQAHPVSELIIATNSTVEGEATAHYLAELAKEQGIPSSRIAQGIPLGGELEYIDGNTLAHALRDREHLA